MKVHAILVHGFNVYDSGAGTVGKLCPYFRRAGISAEVLDYGHFNLFAPRWRNKGVAERLNERVLDLKSIGYQVIVVGHSNGCAITHCAGDQFQAPIDRVVYINPALERHVRFPDSFGSFEVWHNPHDRVVSWARLLPFHPWGDMGKTGFTRFDYRGKNRNIVNFLSGRGGAHSKVFSDDALETIAPAIVAESMKALQAHTST
jgi:pimeloyl-ACP methyl ester carboxylesterase